MLLNIVVIHICKPQSRGRIYFTLFNSAGSILTEIGKSMILNKFFRIEIETKSIFHDSLTSYKIEIEEN